VERVPRQRGHCSQTNLEYPLFCPDHVDRPVVEDAVSRRVAPRDREHRHRRSRTLDVSERGIAVVIETTALDTIVLTLQQTTVEVATASSAFEKPTLTP